MLRKKIGYFLVGLMLILAMPALAAETHEPVAEAAETLSLNQCLALAIKNNKTIQEKEKSVAIAKDAVKEAEAGFWPTLSYQAQHYNSDVSQYEVGPSSENTKFVAGVSASMPLYTGGVLQNQLKLAKIQLDSANEEARKAKQQLRYDVKQAYYQVWLADQVLQVQKSSYDNLDRHVKRVQSLYKVGTASKYQLLKAEVQRDTLKPKVISAQNQLVLTKLELVTIVGLPKDRPFNVQYDVSKLEMPDSVQQSFKKVLDEAYRNRPELHQIQQAAEIKKIQTKMEKDGYKPNVNANLSYGKVNKDLVDSGDWDSSWELTFSVTGKIYDRSIKTKIDQAKGNEDLTAIQEADLRDDIRLDAEQSLQNVALGIENTHANQANIDLAEESLRMTQIRFDNGMATTMDIMDDQLALDQALNGYYQGIVTYLIAEAKIDLVVGKD